MKSVDSVTASQEQLMGLGTTEILLLCGLALLLFGGGKIADIGKGLGDGIRNFKRGIREANEEADSVKAEPRDKKPTV